MRTTPSCAHLNFPMNASELVIVGRFGKTYGVKGWVRVNSYTHPIENILTYSPWFINKHRQWEQIALEDGKPHHNSIIVKLPQINEPETAKLLTNCQIAVQRDQLPQLAADEYYWHDLEGLTVKNQNGEELGKIDHLFATGSNDVFVVKNGQEILIPYTDEVIIEINLKDGVIIVDWEIL